jgi:hypothetical protein
VGVNGAYEGGDGLDPEEDEAVKGWDVGRHSGGGGGHGVRVLVLLLLLLLLLMMLMLCSCVRIGASSPLDHFSWAHTHTTEAVREEKEDA